MDKRVRFKAGQQKKFIETVMGVSFLKPKELAFLVGIHPRTMLDWRRERNRMTVSAAELLSKKYKVPLGEDIETLVTRWENGRNEAAKSGGIKSYEKYHFGATAETRSKGGKVSWMRRKNDPILLARYTVNIKRPQKSVELAELFGLLLGDGGLTHFQCSIYLNSETDVLLAEFAKRLIVKLFGIKPSTYKKKDVKCIRISVSGVNLVEYLVRKGLHVGNKVGLQVTVPEWITQDKEYTKACLRGLIDTDGCFALDRYKVNGKLYSYPKLAFSNKSLPILTFVYNSLNRLGFNPKKYKDSQVWLYNHNEVKRYLQDIGTRNYKPNVLSILESGQDGNAQVR